MKATRIITATIFAVSGVSSVYAEAPNLMGESSSNEVRVGLSNFPPLAAPLGYSGLQMRRADGTNWSGFIDLHGGPVTQVTNAIGGNANQAGPFYANFPLIPALDIAQVWLNNNTEVAGVIPANIYSLRQTRQIAFANWPQFGGLVVGQVVGTSKGDGVYFGEWSKSIGSTGKTNSANLNMTDAERTVWYVGDNAVTSMPTLVNASYSVVGISQTGTDAAGNVLAGGLPHAPNLYQGVLTANYNGSAGSISGAISRDFAGVTQSVDFAGTNIQPNGRFTNNSTIRGQFYNNADALAGMYTGSDDKVAFGGKRQ